MKRPYAILLFLILLLLLAGTAQAESIGQLTDTSFGEQVKRFLSLKDPSVRYALLGSILLGINCGMLGSFIVVRKLSLMGDALSHAVLPGVAMGFLWNMDKDPLAILIGAVTAGLLGSVFVSLITQTTRLKEDTALGMVLAGFFAVGICLVSMIQRRLPGGNQSGIDKYLFGQAAAINSDDVMLMAVVTIAAVLIMTLFYKEFLVSSFDPGFAGVSGLPVKVFHYVLMLLLAFSVVISLQAVGVVLVSAMLITPAASAYLLSNRLHRMVSLAMVFGVFSGAMGCFISFLKPGLPTGPFMVIAASLFFVGAFLFGPRHGVLLRWWRRTSRSQRVRRENTLKAIYQVLEARDFKGEGVSLRELAERRRETIEEARQQSQALQRNQLASLHEDGNLILLTPDGWQRACAIVRNHRLWELYLTNAADYPPDHVHDDAEKIEHILGEEVVRQLERRLDYAKTDPHGKPIPSLDDAQKGGGSPGHDELIGYGRNN